jgi:hypothetical protein
MNGWHWSAAMAPLIVIDPVIRKTYQHLEYSPIINARAHVLGKELVIANERLKKQYLNFIKNLSYHPKLSGDDLMETSYYLLFQDRVDEAIAEFAKVKRDKLAMQMQYDYMRAYLAFSQGEPAAACRLAARYADYPLDRWRGMFADVLKQCGEIEGRAVHAEEGQGSARTQAYLAETEPSLDLKVESKRIRIAGQNIKKCSLNFYKMDTELLFSRSPFAHEFTGQYSYVHRHKTMTVDLPQDHKPLIINVPGDIQNDNLMIEAVAGGVRSTATYTANRLDVQIMENYGQIQAAEEGSGRRLAKVYVKVYARKPGGHAVFYKDGYPDLRGLFDYASLTSDELGDVERFAILVLSDTHGAVIREAAPPKR